MTSVLVLGAGFGRVATGPAVRLGPRRRVRRPAAAGGRPGGGPGRTSGPRGHPRPRRARTELLLVRGDAPRRPCPPGVSGRPGSAGDLWGGPPLPAGALRGGPAAARALRGARPRCRDGGALAAAHVAPAAGTGGGGGHPGAP